MAASTAFLVEVNGTALPAGIAALLVSAVVDDSLRLPDLAVLRFRDPDRTVLSRARIKVGSPLSVSVMTADSATPAQLNSGEVTAPEVEHDRAGTLHLLQ